MKRNLVLALMGVILYCAAGVSAQAGTVEPAVQQAPAPAAELVPLGRAMPDSNASAPLPPGFVSFCIRFADQCQTDTSQPAVLMMTPALWAELQKVNDSVNRSLTPMSDVQHYGVAEYWNIPKDGRGDCEDYALTKRRNLIAADIPARALRIAVVRTKQNQGHAVLTIATDHGDFVMDNLVSEIRSWDNTGYQWVERQDPNNAWAWVVLSPTADSPLVSALY